RHGLDRLHRRTGPTMPEEFGPCRAERINVPICRTKVNDVVGHRDGAFDRAARFILPRKLSRLDVERAHGASLAAKINVITRYDRRRREFFRVLIAPKHEPGSFVESVNMSVR